MIYYLRKKYIVYEDAINDILILMNKTHLIDLLRERKMLAVRIFYE
jgi:hypothetical protein